MKNTKISRRSFLLGLAACSAAGLTYAFCKKNHKMERVFVNEQCFFGFFREISCLGP